MVSSKARWWIGCGLGCAGLAMVAVVVAGLGLTSLARRTTSGFEDAIRDRARLAEFEAGSRFVPEGDGRIPAERIERFLAVRDATAPAREGIQRFFESIPMTREQAEQFEAKPMTERLGSILGWTRSAFGFGENLGGLLRSRNAALLEQRMALDEYTYLYAVVYAAWLGHPLDAGPPTDDHDASDFMDPDTRERIGDDLREALAGQLAAAEAAGAPAEWRAKLAAEVARLEADRRAIPWEHGLPDPLAGSLAPFRERLAAAYSRPANPFELATARKRGRFSFDIE